jgi:hypothetical protein
VSDAGASELVKASGSMKLTSTAFAHGAAIPTDYTRYGKNRSPALAWSGAPPATQSFALVCGDPDAIPVCGHEWLHWAVIDIPAGTTSIPEGGPLPQGATALKTDFGDEAYGGPQPPARTGVHHYHFAVYALRAATLPVKSGATLADIRAAIRAAALDRAILTGTYEKK